MPNIGDLLGDGGFGEVRVAAGANGQLVARKTMNDPACFQRETAILFQLRLNHNSKFVVEMLVFSFLLISM